MSQFNTHWWQAYAHRVADNVVIMEITPRVAGEFLKRNTANRANKKKKIAQYTQSIVDRKWMLNGEPIIFDSDGVLRNGQNRLMAVVKANKSIWSYVVFGVDPKSFQTMDTGCARTASDALGIEGESHTTMTAAAVRLLLIYRVKQWFSSVLIANHEIIDFVNRHPDIREDVHFIAGFGRKASILAPCSVLVAVRYLTRHTSLVESNKFFELFVTGEGLFRGNPVLALRSRLFAWRANNENLRTHAILWMFSKTWEKFINDEPMLKVMLPASDTHRDPPDFKEPHGVLA